MIEQKLSDMGYSLPDAPAPLAAYIPSIKINDLVYTAGQLPMQNGQLKYKGKLGKDVTDEDGAKAAQLCALNCLSVIKAAAGSLDNIDQVVKLTVFVNSSDGFSAQPKIANGASEFILSLFGDKGKHVRSAVGVNELPLDAAVEIEMIVKLSS